MKKEKRTDLVITTIRAPREFWIKVRTKALTEGISAGALVLKALDEYLESHTTATVRVKVTTTRHPIKAISYVKGDRS